MVLRKLSKRLVTRFPGKYTLIRVTELRTVLEINVLKLEQ